MQGAGKRLSEAELSDETVPRDPVMMRLFADAVEVGMALVQQFKAEKRYIGQHVSWPTLQYRENGLPTFSENLFSGPTDYSHIFFPISEPRIEFISVPAFQALLTFARSNEYIRKHFKLSEEGDHHVGNVAIMSTVGDIIDCYIHQYDDDHFVLERFLPLYLFIEASILNSKLQINIVVPLLLLRCQFETVPLGPYAYLGRMSDDFQQARALESKYTLGIHKPVSEAASHALFLSMYEIENKGFWEVTGTLSRLDTYPTQR